MHPRASIVRRTLSVAIVATLVTAGAASATTKKKPRTPPPPKPVCHLIGAGTMNPADQSLKITSADVATNATTLTTVVRVAKLTTGPDASAPMGRQWVLDFTVDGRQLTLGVVDGPFGTTTTYAVGKATLDPTKNEIRYSVNLKDLSNATSSPTVKNGSTSFENLEAYTVATVQSPPGAGAVGFGNTILPITRTDSAQSKAKYLAGYPSCVKVGS